MPFYKEHIYILISLNKEVKKSIIKSFYFSLPKNSPDLTGFEQGRFYFNFETDFEYWKPLIEYSLNNGFEFIYLLNSPKIYNPENDNFKKQLEKLDRLINNLKSTGCNKVRICNPQLMEFINQEYPGVEMYKNIKEFVPSWNLNKNFSFLKNIKKRFPYIKIELMVNEGCVPACPLRTSHNIFITNLLNKNLNSIFSGQFYLSKCTNLMNKNIPWYLCNSNIIYPWEIKEYLKIGINNFKLVGRNSPEFNTGKYLNYYKYYLKGIDDIKNIINIPIKYFNNYIAHNENINYTVKEIKPYLTDIKHFIKYGDLCTSRCGRECNYCNKCAEKIQKLFLNEEKKKTIRTTPFCVLD